MPSAPLVIAWAASTKSPDTLTAAASGALSRNVTVLSGRTSYDGGAGAAGPRPPRPLRAAGGAWAHSCEPSAIEKATINVFRMPFTSNLLYAQAQLVGEGANRSPFDGLRVSGES